MKTTLPPRSEHVAEQLAAITEVIRELMRDEIVMVILFGSYARGDWIQDRYEEDNVIYTYESDFDLLVVTESHDQATMKGESRLVGAIRRRLKREGLDRPSSTIIVADIKHLNNDLQRGQYFYSDIKKEGVLLYDSGRHTLSEPNSIDPVIKQQHARYKRDFKISKEELDYLAARVRKLQELPKRVCEEKIASIA